jgi:peptidyl-prolyl cis-trans isomerase D
VLDQIRNRQRWLTLIFVAAISVVFVLFLGLGGPPTNSGRDAGDTIVQLGETKLDTADFQRTRARQQERLASMLGDQFDDRTSGSFLDAQAVRAMVDQLVLAHSAEEIGLQVSSDEVKEVLRRDPSLRDEEGKFNQENFNAQIRWEYGSQRNFIAAMQRDLLQQKLLGILLSQARVSDAEARSAARYRLEKVRIAYVTLNGSDLSEDLRASDEDVAAYLASHESDLRADYDERIEAFQSPEQVKLRHILITSAPGDPEEDREAAREKAEAVLARLKGGEDFASVASEVSDDATSKDKGGDLGPVVRGDAAPEIELAAFSLEVETVSEIVESPSGLHILLVDEKIEAGTRPFSEVGSELAKTAADAERAATLADGLAAAVKDGENLEDAAREEGLTLNRTAMIGRRRDGYIPGLGASPELLAKAFALKMDAASSPEVFEFDASHVLIQLLEREEPDEDVVAEATEAAKSQLLQARQNENVQRWIDVTRGDLEDDGQLIVNAAAVAAPS